MKFLHVSLLGIALLLCDGCSSDQAPPPAPISPTKLPGDQNITVSTPNTILNRYSAIKQDLTHGKTELNIGTDVLMPLLPIAAGDLLLILQAQGAELAPTPMGNPEQYGAISNLKSAGLFEFVRVESVDETAGTIHLNLQSGGLKNDYRAAGKTQIIWVPQYSKLSLLASGVITAAPWDGTKGGVVAIQAQDLEIVGNIDVSGLGFRAGGANTNAPSVMSNVFDYVSTTPLIGGEKGESILGSQTDYDVLGGRYGRGAPANGGGGGNTYKAGGGGGANGHNMQIWHGWGVMGIGYMTAWQLDPRWTTNGSALTNDSGGGQGGYTSASPMMPYPNPTMTGPSPTGMMGMDVTAWGGNYRRERGGLGGRAFSMANPANRLTFGGGGGAAAPAGPLSQNGGSRGGNGGGMVYLMSKNVHGTGKVLANGTSGESSSPTNIEQGGGGGGGGGTIVIYAPQVQPALYAQGGKGGDHLGTGIEADGPGGGGGGGLIAVNGMGPTVMNVDGGASGKSTSSIMNLFPPNGATSGATGITSPILPFFPSADIRTYITTNTPGLAAPNNTVTYSLQVYNQGPDFATGVSINGVFNPLYPDVTWTCQTNNVQLAQCAISSGTGNVTTQADIAPGSYVTVLITVPVPGYITQNTDPISFKGSASYTADMITTNNIFDYTLSPPADVSISLSPDPIGFQNQGPILYTIPVENKGPYCAHGLDLEITLSPGLTPEGAEGEGFLCSYSAQTIHCTRAELSVAARSTIRVQVRPSSNISSYQAKVKMKTQSFDPDEINNLGIDEASASGLKGTLAGKGCSTTSSSPLSIELFALFLIAIMRTLQIELRKRKSLMMEAR